MGGTGIIFTHDDDGQYITLLGICLTRYTFSDDGKTINWSCRDKRIW
jgi:predicted DNA-binding helix-hairpin-helix protein